MCPACILTPALIASIATTTGGLTLIVKKFCTKNVATQIPEQNKSKENQDGR
jgi:hypothetical protein